VTAKESQVYHLERCLIQMALADDVLADAETEVLEQLVRAVGQLDADVWEQAWTEARSGIDARVVFEQVPDIDMLRRFILRELIVLAHADGEYHPKEQAMMSLAAECFGLTHELTRFVSWAARADAIFLEGEALLDPA
jgi:DnaJ-domain-containing protein 1